MAASILALVVGSSMVALNQLRQLFLRGEEGTEVLREATLFIEHFRNDFQNSVSTADLKISSEEISFPVYRDFDGNTEIASYRLDGKSIQRKLGNSYNRVIVN
ncbi:hypothetical protein HYY75_05215, partial [bacterium]|nr:hypothetical protein [bacterium]